MTSDDQVDGGQETIAESLRDANVGCLVTLLVGITTPFAVLAIVFIVLGFSEARVQTTLNQEAVEVPATIVSSKMRGEPRAYWPDVKFRYQLDGVEQTSDRVWAVREMGAADTVQKVVDRYAPGDEVVAYAIESDPQQAFLERRWSPGPYLSIVVGVVALLFLGAVVLHVVGWRHFQVSAFVTGLFSAGLLSILAISAWGYYRDVPSAEQRDWMIWLFSLTGLGILAVIASLWRIHRLNRLYLDQG